MFSFLCELLAMICADPTSWRWRWHWRLSPSDNVTLAIDGVLFLRVVDPYKASYGVEDPEFAITQLAQTTMRWGPDQLQYYRVFEKPSKRQSKQNWVRHGTGGFLVRRIDCRYQNLRILLQNWDIHLGKPSISINLSHLSMKNIASEWKCATY